MNVAENEKTPEYIDREELIKNLAKIKDLRTLSTKTVGQAITDALAPDVVKVVRCKECWHYVAGYCTRDIHGRTNMFRMYDSDFCSYGEKREGAANV